MIGLALSPSIWGRVVGQSGGVSYSTDAAAFFARLVTQPTITQKRAYATLIDGLKSAGVSSKLEFFHVTAAPDSSTAGVNLLGSNYYLAKIGSVNFQTDFTGYQGTNSVNDYLDPEFLLSAATLYAQNSAALGVYLLAGPGAGADSGVVAGTATGYAEIYPHFTDNKFYWAANHAVEQVGATGSSTGLFSWTRSASNVNVAYRNGVQDTAQTDVSASLTGLMTLMKGSATATRTSVKVGAWFAGAALTASEHLSIYNLLAAYFTAISGQTGSADLITLGGTTSTVISDGAFNATPGLTKLQSGDLLCVYSAASTGSVTDGVWKYKTSSDNGATWSAATTLYTPAAGLTAADVEVMTRADGTVIVAGSVQNNSDPTQNIVSVFVGTANLSSFSGPFTATASVFSGSGIGIISSGKAIELANGNLALPIYGRVTGDGSNDSVGLTFSADGQTWGSSVVIARGGASDSFNEANGFQTASGRIVVIIRRDTSGNKGYSRVTTDTASGASGWSTPANMATGANTSSPGRPAPLQYADGKIFMWGRFGTGSDSRWGWSLDEASVFTPFTPYGAQTLTYFYASSAVISASVIGSVVSRRSSANVAAITYQSFAH